jgi:hypothetical protein
MVLKKQLDAERAKHRGPEPKPQYLDSEGKIFWDCKPLSLEDQDTDFIKEE